MRELAFVITSPITRARTCPKARRWRVEVADEFQDKLFVLRVNVEKAA